MVLFLNHQCLVRGFLDEVALVGEILGFVLSNELATIVFPLLIRALRNKMTHIATIVASPYTLLALRSTLVVLVEVWP